MRLKIDTGLVRSEPNRVQTKYLSSFMADVYSHEVFFMKPYCLASYDLGICMKSFILKNFQSSE